MTLLFMILLGASQMYAQDSSYFFLDCPADVTVMLNDPADGVFVDIPPAVAIGNSEPFVIINDYNDGGADASDVYLVGSTAVNFTAFDSDSGSVSCATEITVLFEGDSVFLPTIVCPANIYIFENDSFGNMMWVDIPEVEATSPAGIASITNSYNDGGANASDYYPVNETTSVIFTATGLNGNAASCLTLVSIYIGGDSTDVYGCTDPTALNYNPFATIDDGSCIYDTDSSLTIVCPADITVFGENDGLVFVQMESALAYGGNPAEITITNDYNNGGANASGLYPFGATIVSFVAAHANGVTAGCSTTITVVYSDDSTDVIYGCTDSYALNYNPYATINDGSCLYDNDSLPGCMAAFQFTIIDGENNLIEISNTSVWNDNWPAPQFFWDFGDGTTSNDPYPTHTYAEDGVYLVCLTLNQGDLCNNTYCDSIGLFGGNKALDGGFTLSVVPSVMVGIAETSLFANELNLYPNPASGDINIDYSLNSNADVNITIYDLSGRIVDFQFAFGSTGDNRERVDVTKLQPGMYILELSANKKEKVISRFIINR